MREVAREGESVRERLVPDVAPGKEGEEPHEHPDARHGDDKDEPPPEEDVDLLVEEVVGKDALHRVLVDVLAQLSDLCNRRVGGDK